MEPPADARAPAPDEADWRELSPGWVADYERAVTLTLDDLQRHTTLDELVQAYFDDAPIADKDAWLAAVCHTRSGRVLNVGIVEDAAYWRRAQQLIATAVAE
ncbi:MAG: hypothetical protein ACR2JY_09330 [Chloroflexota bacterium]